MTTDFWWHEEMEKDYRAGRSAPCYPGKRKVQVKPTFFKKILALIRDF